MLNRPTHKELGGKLRAARQLVSASPDKVIIVDPFKWDEEWDRLARHLGLRRDEVALIGDRLALVEVCLGEVRPENHLWRGHRMFCNRPGYEKVELWEFIWISQKWEGKGMYVKFGFKRDNLCFLSFHPDEPERIVRD